MSVGVTPIRRMFSVCCKSRCFPLNDHFPKDLLDTFVFAFFFCNFMILCPKLFVNKIFSIFPKISLVDSPNSY